MPINTNSKCQRCGKEQKVCLFKALVDDTTYKGHLCAECYDEHVKNINLRSERIRNENDR